MSFDLLTPLTRIAAKLTNTPALVQEVRIGSPASLLYQVTASLTLAGGTPNPEDFDTEGLQQDYLVEFAYDTSGDVDAAERTIIAAVPVFKDRIDHDVTLGGAVVRAHVQWQSASAPEYVAVAGSEVRRFPVIVSCQMAEPNPEA
jgi:hypothetical protein